MYKIYIINDHISKLHPNITHKYQLQAEQTNDTHELCYSELHISRIQQCHREKRSRLSSSEEL